MPVRIGVKIAAMQSYVIYKDAVAAVIIGATSSYAFLIQNAVHASHEVGRTVSKPECTSDVFIIAKGSAKGADLLALWFYQDLPEPCLKICSAKILGIP